MGELAVSDAVSTVTGPETSLNCEAAPRVFQIIQGPCGARLRSPEAHGSPPCVRRGGAPFSRWGWGVLLLAVSRPELLPVSPAPLTCSPLETRFLQVRCPAAQRVCAKVFHEDLAGSLRGGPRRRSLWPLFADAGGKAGFGPGRWLGDQELLSWRPRFLGPPSRRRAERAPAWTLWCYVCISWAAGASQGDCHTAAPW